MARWGYHLIRNSMGQQTSIDVSRQLATCGCGSECVDGVAVGAHAVAVAVDGDDGGVVQEPVENGDGDGGGLEDLAPAGDVCRWVVSAAVGPACGHRTPGTSA